MMKRRGFMLSTALVAVGLAGCARQAQNVATITAQAAQDISEMNSVLQADLPSLSTIPGAANATQLAGQVSATLNAFGQAAKTVTAGIAANAALPVLQQVSAAWNALMGSVKTLNVTLPTTLQEVIADVNLVLPVVLALVGIFMAGAPVKATVPVPTTVDAARLDLRAKAGGK